VNTYEGLFIFPELLNDEEFEAARSHVLAEIERHGGKVLGVRKLGRREFARALGKKQRSGVFVRVVFEIAGDQIVLLRARYRLSDDVTRVQITCGDEQSMTWVQERSAAAEPAAA
jgi:ribosomal protein S6